MAGTPTLCLLLKAPRPGFVKTRLAAAVGPVRATGIYRSLVERQIAAIPSGWRRAVSFSPADATDEMSRWLGDDFACFPQPDGDLGARLDDAVKRLGPSTDAPVFLAGGDCPSLHSARLLAAAETLRGCDAVLWPACDGGYVLIGLACWKPGLFDRISWSTSGVLEESCERLASAGLTFEVLHPPLEDVDNIESFQRFQAGD